MRSPFENGAGPFSIIFSLIIIAVVISASGCIDNDNNGDDEPSRKIGGPWKDLKEMKRTVSDVSIFRYWEADSPGDLDDVMDADKTVYLLIGIEKTITSSDYISIKNFIMDGGKVIVADDGTNANRLGDIPMLSGYEKVEFTGMRYLVSNTLVEENAGVDPGYMVNKYFIKSEARIGNGRFDLIIHEPNGLNHSEEGNPILTTTKQLTIIDVNGNGEIDGVDNSTEEFIDIFRAYGTIGVEYMIGSNGGGILYVSSTGLFTDNAFKLKDNGAWLKSYLYQWLPEGGSVILDQSKQDYNYSPHLITLPS